MPDTPPRTSLGGKRYVCARAVIHYGARSFKAFITQRGAKALGKSRRFIRRRIRTVNIVSIAEYPEQLAVSGIAGVHMQ